MPEDERKPPSERVRRMARAVNDAVVRAPWLWRLLKGPTRRYFEDLADGWDERTGAGSAEHLAALATGLLEVSPPPERALDIGTGTGAAALLVAREFPAARVRGIDLSEEMIRQANHKVDLDPEGRIAFRVADASALPWDDESFDLVTQLNMPPFFAEIARVLRPGGTVVIAASWGSDTPFYTPHDALVRGFTKRGVTEVRSGETGPGTWWVGRKAA